MTCVQCESDTADRETYVAYGGGIFCDYSCLAEFYLDHEVSMNRRGKGAEMIEDDSKVIYQ